MPLSNLLSNARHFALVALLGASVAFAGCGGSGGGGNDDDDNNNDNGDVEAVDDAPLTQLMVPSSGDLDGVVFGDNQQVQSRPDLQPGVGDFAFIQGVSAGSPRSVAYYSFDISALPAGSIIKSATLSLFSRATQGNPQGMMVLVRVDHVNYGNVFPQTLLGAQGLDFNFATINDIGNIGRKDVDAKEQVQADVDDGRETSQFRLRGAIASNLDNITDVAFLTDGEDSFGTGELPMLIIELE